MRWAGMFGAAVALALPLIAGCGSTPETRFYTLEAGQSIATTANAARAPYAVAVGPVTVPPVVDRPQFMIQAAPNRLVMLDEHRWAEPLKSGIPRAIASNLRTLLDARAVLYPQDSLLDVRYRVAVDIRDFISVPGQSASIEAFWTVYGPKDTVKYGRSMVNEPVKEAGYEALAAAHGRALMAVSRDIAAVIRDEEAASASAQANH